MTVSSKIGVTSRKRLAIGGFIALVAIAVVAIAARQMLGPGALFLRLLSVPDADLEKICGPVTTTEVRIAVNGGRTMPMRIYRHASKSVPRTMILLKGLHWDGYDEARFVSFARRLASVGHVVVTPDIPDLRSFDLTKEVVDDIETSCLWTLEHPEFVTPDRNGERKISILGVCFGGGLGLSAATRPSLRGKLASVMSVGGYGDLDRVRRYVLNGRLPNGTVMPPNYYGTVVGLRWEVSRLFPPAEQTKVKALLLEILKGNEAKVRAALPSLSPESRSLFERCLDHVLFKDGDALSARAVTENVPDFMSAVRNPPPDCPVYLLHDARDCVLPYTESEDMARWCSPNGILFITTALNHINSEYEKNISLMEKLRLVRFWTAYLQT